MASKPGVSPLLTMAARNSVRSSAVRSECSQSYPRAIAAVISATSRKCEGFQSWKCRHGAHLGSGARQHPSIAFEEEQPGKRGDALERQTALREQLRTHQHALDDGLVEHARGSRDQRVAPLAGTRVGRHACADAHQVGLQDEQSRMGGSQRGGDR